MDKNILAASLGFAIAACLAPCTALAGGPATTGALATPANNIVGLWTVAASVRPCNNPADPPMNVSNTLLFHAGGTVTENPSVLPKVAGAGRSFGIGTWSFDPNTGRYAGMLRSDNYFDGVYTGYQTVDRDIALNADATTAAGSVVVTIYDANGNQLVQLCGSTTSTRL
jgi:hypothetical protein